MAPPDFYALLGVDRAATNEQVRNAYRDCAMQHHPDRGGDPAVWSALQRAYDTLSDPQKRAVYDRTKQDGSVGAEKAFGQAFAEKGEGAAQQRGLSIEAIRRPGDPRRRPGPGSFFPFFPAAASTSRTSARR